MKRLLPWLIAVLVVAGFCWVFPPVHVRSVKRVKEQITSLQFNAPDFVGKFWNEQLLKAADQAVDVEKLVTVIAASPAKAHDQFGRSVGISSSYYFFVRGTGRVVSMSDDSIGLSLKAEGNDVDISVPLGLVFGNAVRDGTGLLNSSAFPNAQQFNDISAGLNHLVETQVLPELQRIAAVGKRVQFVGCVEVADEDSDLKPLKLVPISVKAE